MQVQGESMAPARMVAFMEQHIASCEACLADPQVKEEIEKVREIVMPPSKVSKLRTADDDDDSADDDSADEVEVEGEESGENGEEDDELENDDDLELGADIDDEDL